MTKGTFDTWRKGKRKKYFCFVITFFDAESCYRNTGVEFTLGETVCVASVCNLQTNSASNCIHKFLVDVM